MAKASFKIQSPHFEAIKAEVKVVYADCDERIPWEIAAQKRNLNYLAQHSVSRDEAIKILKLAGVTSYNEFSPNCLKKFPKDARIYIGRHFSVEIQVDTIPGLPDASNTTADSINVLDNGRTRYWWD